ncbi:MAG: hypothetical protein ACE5D7_01685 [Fidelibacterota bacterium]
MNYLPKEKGSQIDCPEPGSRNGCGSTTMIVPINPLIYQHQKKYSSISRQRSWLLNERNRTTP